MDIEKLKLRIDLIKARVDILKLKANDHDWSCYVPDDVKDSLEGALVQISEALTELSVEPRPMVLSDVTAEELAGLPVDEAAPTWHPDDIPF